MIAGGSDVLRAIVAASATSAAARARVVSIDVLARRAEAARPRAEAFAASLSAGGLRVVAECKRRSPSRGVLRRDYDPAAIARSYEQAGAAAISVLTEPTSFDGSLDHLRAVRRAVALPILRKDFIVSEYQLVEAREAGADAVLLIVAALDQAPLERLVTAAAGWGLAALVEVHSADELARARDAGASIVGVNSRDLRTLAVDLRTFDQLIAKVPDAAIAVAESGLTTRVELLRLSAAGFDAFLVGERFMTSDDPGDALAALIGAPRRGPRA
jgi:indole-3-glycerol phosphate synthase